MEDAAKKARQSPTPYELAVWREYVETAEDLRRALSAELQSASGISPGDYAVLLALSEAEEHRMRSSILAEEIGWERSRLSHHLGRMENRGLVRRHRSGQDNRGAVVELTGEGAQTFRSSSASHLRLVRKLFIDALTPQNLEAARNVAASLRTHLKSAESS
ncbi:MarR family transcriptional regulator [Arthrobacter sp. TS-15]|uniref:MarR family winged helix-turn-helix transcriptional regulator n=1 Tax=Arthrobacter sp. TS-15 TaxID=2510797 RepID=UPI00115E0245|nr:MarR family winged helix-turn-helix transcriptional regulator [Arthrobacter sp. TS-15]TQS88941.1 MarR family transcriptional regulator [Arthrobacter sp. TS-15]